MSLSYLLTDPAEVSLRCDPNSSHFIPPWAWFLSETSQIFTRARPLRRNASKLNPQTDFLPTTGSASLGSALSQNTCLTGSLAHHASAFFLKCPTEMLARVAMVCSEIFTGKLYFWDTRKEKLNGLHLYYRACCLETLYSSLGFPATKGHTLPSVLFVWQLILCAI